MLEYIEIVGGTPLSGTVKVSGAKNAALPLLIASLLTSEQCEFENVPNLQDVNLTLKLLEHFGASAEFKNGNVSVEVPSLVATEASYSLVKALRASFWVLAPLLARGRAARVALPGGDIIGARPVDMHLEALTKMGADIKVKHGVVFAFAPSGLRPAEIDLRFPSVGATHQIIMAASLTLGTTVIRGAAREPEIVALTDMLISMGCEIEGAGTPTIVVRGREELRGSKVTLIGDRIEAGTYALAALASGGDVTLEGINPAFFGEFLDVLTRMGADVSTTPNSVRVALKGRLKSVSVSTAPFPGFATDFQAPLMAALCVAEGESVIEEHVFEGRFGHVSELCRMGANIRVVERAAIITGVPTLNGALVEGHDIRGAAALVVGAFGATGETRIHEIQHLRRGYESLEKKLSSLGARISCRVADAEDFLFAGC